MSGGPWVPPEWAATLARRVVSGEVAFDLGAAAVVAERGITAAMVFEQAVLAEREAVGPTQPRGGLPPSAPTPRRRPARTGRT